jgi:hypothetical protein
MKKTKQFKKKFKLLWNGKKLSSKGQNAFGIILGQEYEPNKFLVGIGIDDKPNETVKGIDKINGMIYFKEF